MICTFAQVVLLNLTNQQKPYFFCCGLVPISFFSGMIFICSGLTERERGNGVMNYVHFTAMPPMFPQPVNLQVHHCSWQMTIHHSKDLELNLSCTENTGTHVGA